VSTSGAGHRSAILAMLAAVLAFAVMDAMMKRLSQWYGPYELACLRCLSSLAILSPLLLRTGSIEALYPRQLAWHACRAALGLIMLTTFVYAVRRMSLASAYAIYLTAPLLITAISTMMFMRCDIDSPAGIGGAHLPCKCCCRRICGRVFVECIDSSGLSETE
jgi:drug/metabolite transporter (DMT)-like permease